MKRNEVKVLLAITVLSVGMAMSGCGKQTEVVEPPVVVEQVSENDISDNTPEATPEPTQTPEAVDENLDTTLAGTYYIITEEQNLYKECNQASEVVDTLPIDSEIIVSGLYGDTGLFQVVDADATILGYVNSEFCDTVKGGYVPNDTETTTPEEGTPSEGTTATTPSEGTGLTEEDLGITQEELNEAIQNSNPLGDSDGIIGSWDGSGSTPSSSITVETGNGGSVSDVDTSGAYTGIVFD